MHGDRYAGEWPRERFAAHGITYVVADKVRSDLYRDLLPLLNSRQVELLDHPRLVAQLCSLERRTARGGKDSIDHAPGAHDDLANAAAGALVMRGCNAGAQRGLHRDTVLTRALRRLSDLRRRSWGLQAGCSGGDNNPASV